MYHQMQRFFSQDTYSQLKNFGKPDQYYKARLVTLGHVDPDKPRVVNEAPTVLKSSIRLEVSLIASHGF